MKRERDAREKPRLIPERKELLEKDAFARTIDETRKGLLHKHGDSKHLRTKAASLTKRWQWRQATELFAEADRLEHSKGNEEAVAFDKRIQPCALRYKNARNEKDAKDAHRALTFMLTKRSDPIPLIRSAVSDICDDCGVRMRVIANDSMLGCPKCAKSREIVAATAPFTESEYIASTNAQKSRLVEWLEFCQAKEYTEPPREVIDSVIKYLTDNRLTGLLAHRAAIRNERLKGPFISATDASKRLKSVIPNIDVLLRELNSSLIRAAMQAVPDKSRKDDHAALMRKNYEHAPKIAARISGLWPPRFTLEQEERLRDMFTTAAPVYERNRKPPQPHWPGGYAYFLRCVCTLLGWDEFVDHFPVVKAARTAVERDAQRRIIWNQLGWQFIPSTTNPKPLTYI